MLFDCVMGTSGFGLSVKTVHSWDMKLARFSYKEESRRSLGSVFSFVFLSLPFFFAEASSEEAILMPVALLIYADIVFESRDATRYQYTAMPRLSRYLVSSFSRILQREAHLFYQAIVGTL